MNFLEIAQEVDRLALTQGQISSVTPTNEFQLSLIERVRTVNHDIHMLRKDWNFNYTEVPIPVQTTDPTYTPTGIRKWKSIICDGQYLREVPYEVYLREDWTDSPREPFKYTIHPNKSLIFNTPDINYVVSGQGYLLPDVLTDGADVPRIPEEYHYTLVYGTLVSLGASISIGNIIEEYNFKYSFGIDQMMRDYIPSKVLNKRPLV